MTARAPRNAGKSKEPTSAPVAAPEIAGTTGETSTTKADAGQPGESVSQGAVAPAAGEPAAVGATGDTLAVLTDASQPGETVNQGATAPAGSDADEAGSDTGEGVQGAVDDAAGSATSVFPQLAGAKLFLDDRPAIALSDVATTLPELREAARSPDRVAIPATTEVELVPVGWLERVCSVSAPNGPRWRAGIQFGPKPRNVTRTELGADPEKVLRSLQDDPHLHIGPPIDDE